MYALLFAEPVVDRTALRLNARNEVHQSPLIRACATGTESAIIALTQGFWPFVSAFEKAIDTQVGRLPLRPLMHRFGHARIRRFFAEARAAVREMREEEGSHAALWQEAAAQLGVELAADNQLTNQHMIDGVAALLHNADADDPVEFFCWLAGTEYIAEELAACLCGSPAFLAQFPDNRWAWGEAHMAGHDGPSHLEIDEDLARAYHPATNPQLAGAALTAHIRRCQRLFGLAAQDVMAHAQSAMVR